MNLLSLAGGDAAQSGPQVVRPKSSQAEQGGVVGFIGLPALRHTPIQCSLCRVQELLQRHADQFSAARTFDVRRDESQYMPFRLTYKRNNAPLAASPR